MKQPKDGGGLGPLNDNLGFHIRLAHGTVYRHFMETFSDLGLTQKQVSVLWLIDLYPGIAQIDLAKRLQIDRATLMAIVNRLQARNYLVRGQLDTDKRRQTLHLLPEGAAALKKAQAAVFEHEAWLKARFTSVEVDQLIVLLGRIHG